MAKDGAAPQSAHARSHGARVAWRPRKPTFFDRPIGEGIAGLSLPADKPDLRGYIELALVGGFPEAALRLCGATRRRWFDSYVEQLLTRDAERLTGLRNPAGCAAIRDLALSTAGVVEKRTDLR